MLKFLLVVNFSFSYRYYSSIYNYFYFNTKYKKGIKLNDYYILKIKPGNIEIIWMTKLFR